MEFCPKCGSTMTAKKDKKKKKMTCRRCGHEKQSEGSHIVHEELKKKPMDEVVIFDKKSQESLPTVKVKCSKCGNDEAVWWLKQMRSGDEPPTIFYRCTKCRHTWRQY